MGWAEELFIEKSDMFLVRMNALWGLSEEEARAIDRIIKRYLPSSKRVLDLMCGNGRIAINLAKLGYDVTGLDFSEKFIDDAKNRAKELGTKVKFIIGDVRSLEEYIKGPFDVVLNFWTSIGYFGDETDLEIFRKVHSILRGGGLFMILNTASLELVSSQHQSRTIDEVEDNVFIEHHRYDPESGRYLMIWKWYKRRGNNLEFKDEATVEIRLYSKHEVVSLLKKAGFEIVGILHSHRSEDPARIDSPINIVARKRLT